MIPELYINVINSFKALKLALNNVGQHIEDVDRDLPAWFQAPSKLHMHASVSTRQQVSILLKQVEYLDDQEPREILVGAGILAASARTLEALQALNDAKKDFKTAMLKLRAAKVATGDEHLSQNFEDLLPQREPGLTSTMQRMGLARIHLKQCYRTVPFFKQRPNKLAWTWANTRSIKKISIAEAELMLTKHSRDAGIERQLKLLQGLDPNEKLAIIQELAPHLRANIVMPSADGTQRIMVKGPVPIFYLMNDNAALPDFTPPGSKRGKDKERIIRKDVKIDPEPFLPAIRAHRYKKSEILGPEIVAIAD
jgi:hypothetical protein